VRPIRLEDLWPDQAERLERLRGALEVARRVPATVERADAAAWLEERLADPLSGAATVVFHSIVFFYLDAASRARVRGLMAEAGERATPGAPVAWLFLEMESERFVVRSVCGRRQRSVRWLRARRTAPRSGGSYDRDEDRTATHRVPCSSAYDEQGLRCGIGG